MITEFARTLDRLVPLSAPGGQLVVHVDGRRVVDASAGDVTENEVEISSDTLFDLASITKLFTAIAFMRLVDAGQVALDDPVQRLLPLSFGGTPSGRHVSWRALLTHTSGLPAGVDLQISADLEEARKHVLAVLPASPQGSHVVYSDVGFMLLGFGIERLVGSPLDTALRSLVTGPLGLKRTLFGPVDPQLAAPTEVCQMRSRRLRGEVHDENAFALGGVAGHAGMFSTAGDLANLGESLRAGGSALLRSSTVAEMVREQAVDGPMRRGLGLSLWSPDPDASSHPFGPNTYGHTGFTGTSLWIDPDRQLVVALLSNPVFRGRDDREFSAARIALHRDVVNVFDGANRRQGGS